MVQHRATHTTTDQHEVIHDLSNGAIFNDLERLLVQNPGATHYLT